MSHLLSRRSFLQMTALSALGVAVVACAPMPAAAPAASEGQTDAAADKTTVRFHARVGTQGDFYTAMADEFNLANPDVNVVVETFPNNEFFQKIATMMAGGTVGDGMWTASILNYYTYAAANAFLPLDDYVSKDNYDLSVFYDVGVQACKVEDKMYGLPWIVHPGRVGLYYNKTAFESAGMDVPTAEWTYDDLLAASRELTVTEGDQTTQWGFLPETGYFGLVMPIRSYGGDWMNPEGTQCTVNSEEAVTALKLWEQVYQTDHTAPTPAQVDDSGQMWASGRIIMLQSGYWTQSTGKNLVKDFEWMVAPMPKGPAGSRGMFEMDANVIFASSQASEATWEYLKTLSSKEAGIKIALAGSVPGGRPDVWEDPQLNDYAPHAVFTEVMKTIDPLVVPANYRYQELEVIAKNDLDPVWLGDKTVDEVIETLTSDIQQTMDMPRL